MEEALGEKAQGRHTRKQAAYKFELPKTGLVLMTFRGYEKGG